MEQSGRQAGSLSASSIRRAASRYKEVHGVDGLCLVGIEAVHRHYCSRELQEFGHTVKLMPPSYVKAYLKRRP